MNGLQPVVGDADEDAVVDLSKDMKIGVTSRQLWRGALAIAGLCFGVAAVLPNVLPKTWKIATESYVEAQAGAVNTRIDVIAAKGIERDDQLRTISVSIKGFAQAQNRQTASQEADRVTRSIRNADDRVSAYQRVHDAAMRNLTAGREPLEGVSLDF